MYNIYYSPPKKEGVCDRCGGELLQRADDNEATIGNRLKVYQDQTEPLVAYYQKQDKLAVIEGEGSIDEIYGRITQALDA